MTAPVRAAAAHETVPGHRYRALDVAVDGGPLRVGVWDAVDAAGEPVDDAPTVLAVHGITASHRAWTTLVGELAGVRVVAPDLRGRGRSNTLPGPFGMVRHADDVAAVVRAVAGAPVVVVGHSMGAFVSVVLADRHPGLVAGLLLVDGGVPLPDPPGVDPDAPPAARLAAVLGPAAERLQRTFPDVGAYREFWAQHPAFADLLGPAVLDYVDYDLVPAPGGLRPASDAGAVAADSLDLHGDGPVAAALDRLDRPTVVLRAPRGLLDDPAPLYPPEHLATWTSRVPALRPRDVPDVNHYTIVMGTDGSAAVAAETRALLGAPTKEVR
ncbi:alpha/beta hydrolase family protein [Isoptericola jiangsuensis]|uniref:Alpha/beta hydrolase family protein n=1 Tax=Isoptericola jiangsuensis TaxID=548579 RepID=A0A2A9EVY3_9MICO|nr:alpha/beta hydrolase [Isoptericola jiangsuensis]PFG42442.1 alpha/beta hydrolase family protein [Isoptericola jiangsuensis]